MTMDIVDPSTAPDHDAIRAQLTQERDEILGSVELRRGEVEDGPSGVSDGSGETEHLTIAEFKELSQHLDRMASETLTEIEAALARLDDGSYGECVDCGEQINSERLEALPAAARCVNCQARQG
jgi:DnaK suppressor protein